MDKLLFKNLVITLLTVGVLAILCDIFNTNLRDVLLVFTLVYVMDTNSRQKNK